GGRRHPRRAPGCVEPSRELAGEYAGAPLFEHRIAVAVSGTAEQVEPAACVSRPCERSIERSRRHLVRREHRQAAVVRACAVLVCRGERGRLHALASIRQIIDRARLAFIETASQTSHLALESTRTIRRRTLEKCPHTMKALTAPIRGRAAQS